MGSSTQGPSGSGPVPPGPYSSREDRGPSVNKDQKPFSIHSKKQPKENPEEAIKEKAEEEDDEKLEAERKKGPPASIFTLSKETKPKPPLAKGEDAGKFEHLMPEKPIVKHAPEKPTPKNDSKKGLEKDAKSPFDVGFHRKTKDEGAKDHDQGGQQDPNLQPSVPQLQSSTAPTTEAIGGTSSDIPSALTDYKDLVRFISSIYVRESHIDGHQTTVNLKDGTSINVQNIAGTLAITISTADYRVQKMISDNIANIREALGLKNIKISEINIETSSMDDKERDQWSEDQQGEQDESGNEGSPR